MTLPPPGYHNPPGLKPEVFLLLDDVGDAETLVGFPIIVRVSVNHPQASDARVLGTKISPLVVAAQTGTWGQFVRLVVRNSSGVEQQWAFHLEETLNGTLVLDAQSSGHATLTLSPQISAGLSPGQYSLDVWFDSRNGATDASWQGVAHDSATLLISPVPSPLPPDWQCEQAAQLARYYGDIQGDTAKAIATLDALLATQPTAVMCLARRGQFAEKAGDICGAWMFYRRGRDAANAWPDPDGGVGEPSVLEFKVHDMQKMLPDGGCPG